MRKQWFWLLLQVPLAWAEPQSAATLDASLQTAASTVTANRSSQQYIEALDNETRAMADEYRNLLRQIDSLHSYNQDLQSLVQSQDSEKESLQQQILGVETTQREIIPLMRDMVAVLRDFVALDVPFLPEERRERVKQLQDLLERADVTVAEKFRRILEAYQVESEYGRTLESYSGRLTQNGTTRTLNFVRVGRIGLYYESLDGQETGRWNPQSQQWELAPQAARAVHQALRMARREINPDFLTLPLPAAASDVAGTADTSNTHTPGGGV